MSDISEVESAEAKMHAAKDALLKFVERRGPIDRDSHRSLVARLKKAQAEFLKAISELNK